MQLINKHHFKLSILAGLVSAVLCGCGGHNHSSGSSEDSALSVTLGDLMSGKPYAVKISGASAVSSDVGEVSKINPVTGLAGDADTWFFTVPDDYFTGYSLTYDNLKSIDVNFTVTGEGGEETVYQKSIALEDPLLMDQWHLYNIGQNPFKVTVTPLAKIDLNVIPAWRTVLTDADGNKVLADGSGVKMVILDNPVDFNHEDLASRKYEPEMLPEDDAAIVNVPVNVNWLAKSSYGLSHGTEVAGIAGASAMNGAGGRGVAFNAQLTSVSPVGSSDIIDQYVKAEANNAGNETDEDDDDDQKEQQLMTAALQFIARHSEFRVVNASIGKDNFGDHPDAQTALDKIFQNNTALLHAEGNEFEADSLEEFLEENSIKKDFISSIDTCKTYKSPCLFEQTDNMSRHPYVINVGSLNASGQKATYSSVGPNMWIMGIGGEFGYYDEITMSLMNIKSSGAAIVTTLSSFPLSSIEDDDEDTPWRVDDPNQQKVHYTAKMNGTSAATPTVSGIVALLYQAKPDLTIPQLRYILASTARNDEVFSSMAQSELTGADSNGNAVVLDQGWIKNAAGWRYSSYYGFGLIDAKAALDKALSCSEDEVCQSLASAPQVFYSTNENPCAVNEDGDTVCTLKNFVQNGEAGTTELTSALTVDAMTFDLSGYSFSTTQSDELCQNVVNVPAEDTQDAVTAMTFLKSLVKINNTVQMDVTSPSGTWLIVKPMYSNTDMLYNPHEPDLNIILAANGFYRETISPDGEFVFKIKTGACKLNLDLLNSKMKVTVYGYTN